MSGPRQLDHSRLAIDVLDSLLEGFQIIDPEWTYVFVNAAAARQGGKSREELVGRTMMECYPGIDTTPMFAVLRDCMAQRRRQSMDNQFTFADGSVGWFELRFIPVSEGVCILSVDITDRKRAQAALEHSEAQLRQTQKMDAIGRLASGVAHDFNNLLSVILSYAELAREGSGPGSPVAADIEQITVAGRRAAELTAQLMTLSRNQVASPRPTDLSDCTAAIGKMLQRVLPSSVHLKLVTAPGLRTTLVDPGQIEQVVMNLAVNARDAMPDGGTLTIETANVDLDESFAHDFLGVTPGPHVMLAVGDTGTGIDKETQQKIFEPFFSTKARGRGTGLGLSIVYGIVRQSAGSIRVHSELGRGTTFRVYFPVAPPVETAASGAAVRTAARHAGDRPATILVVDDEAQIRKLVTAILERDGHVVLSAATPVEALEVAKVRGKDIDLLLTDLVMPGMHGRELAQQLTTDFPALPTLFMSGFTDDFAFRQAGPTPALRFLQKPFTPDALIESVREALGGGRDAQ